MTFSGWLEAGVLVWFAIAIAEYPITLRKFSQREWKSLGNGFILTVIFWPFAVWNSAKN